MISKVSMIFAATGLPSASRHVTAQSGEPEFDDDGVVSKWLDTCDRAVGQRSDSEPFPETDEVGRRLGIEYRRETSLSRKVYLKCSIAPNSERFRE